MKDSCVKMAEDIAYIRGKLEILSAMQKKTSKLQTKVDSHAMTLAYMKGAISLILVIFSPLIAVLWRKL